MKILQNEITGTQTKFSTNFGAKLSFNLSFIFPESAPTAATYTFSAPTCTITIITFENTITIITFENCALNAEFQHFISKFKKISLLHGYN